MTVSKTWLLTSTTPHHVVTTHTHFDVACGYCISFGVRETQLCTRILLLRMCTQWPVYYAYCMHAVWMTCTSLFTFRIHSRYIEFTWVQWMCIIQGTMTSHESNALVCMFCFPSSPNPGQYKRHASQVMLGELPAHTRQTISAGTRSTNSAHLLHEIFSHECPAEAGIYVRRDEGNVC